MYLWWVFRTFASRSKLMKDVVSVFVFTLICLGMAGQFLHVLAATDLSKHSAYMHRPRLTFLLQLVSCHLQSLFALLACS